MVSEAQSRGEWPGLRRTFLEGREVGGSVDIEGWRVDCEDGGVELGGVRRVDAAEGGGRRVVEGLGIRGCGILGGAIGVEEMDEVYFGADVPLGLRDGGGMFLKSSRGRGEESCLRAVVGESPMVSPVTMPIRGPRLDISVSSS